jgi:Zn-finger nucleic acid-binding protein
MEKDVMNLARMIWLDNGERRKVLIVSNKQTFHYNIPIIES